MMTQLRTLIVACTLLLANSVSMIAADIAVFVSPNIPETSKQDLYRQLLQTALERLAPGEALTVYNGLSMEKVCVLAVPAKQAYARHVNARKQVMMQDIRTLQAWIVRQSPASRGAAVHAPNIFRFMSGNSTIREGDAVILIGSPIFNDPQEPAYSMAEEYIPSDAHLALSRSETIFGAQDCSENLRGVRVHWAYLEEPFAHDRHRYLAERWWTLYTTANGAALVAAGTSLEHAFEACFRNVQEPIMAVEPEPEAEFAMLRAINREVRTEEQATAAPAEPVAMPQVDPGLDFMVSENIAETPLSKLVVNSCKIGIRWEGKHDLDLYVQPGVDAKELSYKQNSSPQGRHIKDWRTSPTAANGFETVELSGEIDLSRLRISVNYFRGHTPNPPVTGRLRIAIEGKIFEQEIALEASQGNGGRDAANREASPQWVVVDPLAVVGLR